MLVKLGADLNRVRQHVIQLRPDDQGAESADVSMAVPERGKLATDPAGAPAAVPGRGKRPVAARVSAIGSRLSAVRQRVGARPGAGGLGRRPSASVHVTLVGVRVDQRSDQPVALLKEVDGDRYMPIWIGPVEATAIALAQEGRKPAAPLTHDLFCDVLTTMGAQLLNVTISTLRDIGRLSIPVKPPDGVRQALRRDRARDPHRGTNPRRR